jgi:hypothetical protein
MLRPEMYDAASELLVEMNEWCTARPEHESAETSATLKDQVGALMQKEEEQGTHLFSTILHSLCL